MMVLQASRKKEEKIWVQILNQKALLSLAWCGGLQRLQGRFLCLGEGNKNGVFRKSYEYRT